MTNIKFNKINPAFFTRIQPIANTPPDTATVAAAITRLNTRMRFQEFADVPLVNYIIPAEEAAAAGPILDDGVTNVFQDVHGNGQWLLPTFTKKDPLQGGFNFTCTKNGKTSDSAGNIIDNYTGTITISLDTDLPDPAQGVVVSADKVLPLNNLTAVLNFKLANGQLLTYQPVVVLAGTVCTLTFNADDLGVLTNLYKILSDPTSLPFCSLVIQGTYWGFRKKEAPQKLIKFRNFVQLNRGITFKPRFKPLEVQPAFSVNRRIIKSLEQFETPENTDLQDPYVTPENNTPPEEPTPVEEPQITDTPEVVPEVVPQDDTTKYEQVDNVPYISIIPVSFDCATYPNNYIVADGDSQTVFGCNPPFDTSIVRKHKYAQFSILTGSLSEQHYGINAIYRNQLNNNYLIIPEQYLIVLEDPSDTGQLVPSAYLNTTININDGDGVSKSTANFKFNVAPNLSAWQVRRIKELIVKNLPQNLGKTLNDIYIEYPQALDAAQSQQLFNGHNIPVAQAINLGTDTAKANNLNVFHIEFKQVPIHDGTAATLAGLLKTTAGGLVDKFVWKIETPADIVVQSAVKLSLFTVTGDALSYSISLTDNTKYLSNNSLYDIAISNYSNNGATSDVTPAALIGGNNTIAISSLSFGAAISNVSDLNYGYKADDDYVKQVLKELRFNADEVDDSIIVTNNTGLFAKHNIKQIEFNISITKSGDTDPDNVLTSATKSITEDGVINHIAFILPVANYLSDWSAIYYTVITFTNDTAPLTTEPVLIDDINKIGKVINLTATSLGLN